MRIAIFGQRNIGKTEESTQAVHQAIDNFISRLDGEFPVFLIGGASGAQEVAFDYLGKDYDFITFKPWTMISKRLEKEVMGGGPFDPTYFFYRNIQIVDNSDVVIILNNKEKDAEVYKVKNLCERKNKTVIEYDI